jgi:hypothetical protein
VGSSPAWVVSLLPRAWVFVLICLNGNVGGAKWL